MRINVLIMFGEHQEFAEFFSYAKSKIPSIADHYAKSLQDAILMLSRDNYQLILFSHTEADDSRTIFAIRQLTLAPILILLSNSSLEVKTRTLALGADAYLVKPYSIHECFACSHALVRRSTEYNNSSTSPLKYTIVHFRDLTMIREHRRAFIRNEEIVFTRREFDILLLLISRKGQVFTHEQIYEHIYNDGEYVGNEKNAIRCEMRRIRKKLLSHNAFPDYIKTIREIGYRIDI